MKRITVLSAVAATVYLSGSVAWAQAAQPGPIPAAAPAATAVSPTNAEKKQIFALVAAVGDQFTYVRQKESTGSNIIDNNIRNVIRVKGNGLNLAVLRGLETGMTAANPDGNFEYITLNHEEMEGVLPQKREEVAIGKIVAALEKYPGREKWEKIIVATPKYLFTERAGMGPKLNGIGVYVQPLTGGSLEGSEGEQNIDVSNQGESDTTNPEDGTKNKSKTYVAPYTYLQVYVLDPKTLRVIEKVARHDFVKLNDPNSLALDVGKSIPVDVLATRMNTLIERSAARALGETATGATVTISEIKPPAAGKAAAPK